MVKSTNLTFFSIELILEIARGIFYFPVWWYTKGLWKFIKNTSLSLSERQKSLALFIWIKNIFTPMYGQRDLSGKFISFFIRLIQIIFRAIVLIFWLIVSLVEIIIWLVLPIFVVYQIMFQLGIFKLNIF